MNVIQKSLLGFGLSAGLILSAGSSWADSGHKNSSDGDRAGRFEQRMQERANDLKAALQLTAQQEQAWQNFQSAIKPSHRQGTRQEMRDTVKNMKTPERLDWMKSMKAQRDEHMTQRDQAIRVFYAQLSEQQKTVFDSQFWMRGGQRKHRDDDAKHGGERQHKNNS